MTVFLNADENKLLRQLLIEKNVYIPSPCGGNGKCGKCKIKLLFGETEPKADEDGFVTACKTKLITDCGFYIPETEGETVLFDEVGNAQYAICDVGTTNIKIRKYNEAFELLSERIFANPQIPFGADVISRISAAKNGFSEKLSSILRERIAENLMDVDVAYICGNPTMIHFMADVNPSPIGVYPFEPVFKETRLIEKRDTGFNFRMVLLPSASGYVGSDAICGIYTFLKTNYDNKNILIADIGTNGEISLIKNGKIYSATTAAGPAIEGAEIEMGRSGGDGVIYTITKDGKPKFRGEKPTGINGAGLISLIAFLLEKGILSPEGRLVSDVAVSGDGCERNESPFAEEKSFFKEGAVFEKKYFLSKEVYVSERDISGFMVAKSAVKTAIEILLSETETDYSEIGLFVLAGGVCRDLEDINSAVISGLIPKELKEKTTFIPELAIMGANTAYGLNEINELENLSSEITVLSLSDNESFEERFIMNTFFEE